MSKKSKNSKKNNMSKSERRAAFLFGSPVENEISNELDVLEVLANIFANIAEEDARNKREDHSCSCENNCKCDHSHSTSYSANNNETRNNQCGALSIERVIYCGQATIVYWGDHTKTVVKCQDGDTYSKETGFAMALAKKVLGNSGNYNDIIREIVNSAEVYQNVGVNTIPTSAPTATDRMAKARAAKAAKKAAKDVNKEAAE